MEKVKKSLLILLFIAFAGFMYNYGLVFAKYVYDFVWNYYLVSKGFHFNSDYLGSDVIKNVDNLWNGESVHFDLRNNLNQSVITGYDITYDATCTVNGDASSHVACHLNGTSSNVISNQTLASVQSCVNNKGDEVDVNGYNQEQCETGGYEWIHHIAENDLYFDIVLTDMSYVLTDVIVNVTVTSTAPYYKVLSGDFALHKLIMQENAITSQYKNYDNYDKLIISNSHTSAKCVKASWDTSKLLINESKANFSTYQEDSNGYINEIHFNIDPKDSLSYIFNKRDFNMVYDLSEFTIEEAEGC